MRTWLKVRPLRSYNANAIKKVFGQTFLCLKLLFRKDFNLFDQTQRSTGVAINRHKEFAFFKRGTNSHASKRVSPRLRRRDFKGHFAPKQPLLMSAAHSWRPTNVSEER